MTQVGASFFILLDSSLIGHHLAQALAITHDAERTTSAKSKINHPLRSVLNLPHMTFKNIAWSGSVWICFTRELVELKVKEFNFYFVVVVVVVVFQA
jgi:hypothetical protein